MVRYFRQARVLAAVVLGLGLLAVTAAWGASFDGPYVLRNSAGKLESWTVEAGEAGLTWRHRGSGADEIHRRQRGAME